MKETVGRFSDITLIVEFNATMHRAPGHSPDLLIETLHRLGFETFLIDDQSRRAVRLRQTTDWSQIMDDSYANLYCVKRERALSVCMFSHTAALGGAERSLLRLATDLIGLHGVLCTIVLPEQGPLVEELELVGASCIVSRYNWCCAAASEQLADERRNQRIDESIDSVLSEIVTRVKEIDPDIIWTQTMVIPWGAMVASVLSKPHVWSVCEYGERDHGLKFFWPLDQITDDIMACSAHVYAASKGIAKFHFPHAPSTKVSVLYDRVSIPDVAASSEARSIFSRPNGVKIGMFATLSPAKGQEDALRATAELVTSDRDVELLLAGTGDAYYERQLVRLAEDLGITDRVRFSGFLVKPYAARQACDIVLVCSRNEAFGRVAIEAMLLAKPVVYTATGGMLETMVDGKTGLSYPPGDIGRLATQLEALIADRERAKALGECARLCTQTFLARSEE
jgi:glycosyltransferase involved in cell wall biosynthesis